MSFALIVLVLALRFPSAGAGAAEPSSFRERGRSTVPGAASGEVVRARRLNIDEGIVRALSRRGVLVAVTRWGSTSFGAFEVSSETFFPAFARETGELVYSHGAGRLAFMVRDGPNPARNYIEVWDAARRLRLVLEPAPDYAILGFALSPTGEQLSYAAMNLKKSRSTQMTWRAGLVDLEGPKNRIVLGSGPDSSPAEAVAVPFAWSSRTGRIYLQGWLPFRGMAKRGIWSMDPDGSRLDGVLAEPSYTGTPALSPDGALLAYLATDRELLPSGYVAAPGAPPGNVLSVMDLAGEKNGAWARSRGGAFGHMAWSPAGRAIWVSEQAWQGGRFRDVALRRIEKNGPASLIKVGSPESMVNVASMLECRDGTFFWVEEGSGRARLRSGKDKTGAALLSVRESDIRLLRCLEK